MRFLFNLKLLFRLFQKSPGFAILAVFIVGLGIGANTLVFSIIDATLIHPFPYKDASRIEVVWETDQYNRTVKKPVSPFNFDAISSQTNVFSAVSALRYARLSLTDSGQPDDIVGAITTASLFDTAETKPLLGRTLLASDDGGSRVVVLSEGLWRRRFGSDPSIVGRQLSINNESVTVVGVMPTEFQLPQNAQAWLSPKWKVPEPPVHANQDPTRNRDLHYLRIIARRKPEVTPSQVAAQLEKMARIFQLQNSSSNEPVQFRALSLRDEIFGNVKPALLALSGAVAFLLLMVCANMCNLMLARAANRRKETAVHLALGAPRSQLLFRSLSESIGLSIVAGLTGAFIFLLGLHPLLKLDPRFVQTMAGGVEAFNIHLALFVLTLSVFVGSVFGLFPALQFSKLSISSMIREFAGTTTFSRSHGYIRNILMIGQIGISLALLVCSGLMVNSFVKLTHIDPGFASDHLLTLSVSLPQNRYSSQIARSSFYDRTLSSLAQIPGVKSAAAVTDLALRGDSSSRIVALPGQQLHITVNDHVCSPNYFATMRIPMLMGRDFNPDDTTGKPDVAIINKSLATRLWPHENPIGRKLQTNANGDLLTIVGVVGDVKQIKLEETSQPQLYTPYSQMAWPFFTFILRTQTKPEELASAGLTAIWNADPAQPVSDVSTMDQIIETSLRQRKFLMVVLALFSTLSLVLAAVGLFGVISYSVAQRTKEIGVRMALGADRMKVLQLFLKQAGIVTSIGAGLGLLLSFFLTQMLRQFLYGVTPTDPATLIVVTSLFFAVSLAATYIPAFRAANVDPIIALRQ